MLGRSALGNQWRGQTLGTENHSTSNSKVWELYPLLPNNRPPKVPHRTPWRFSISLAPISCSLTFTIPCWLARAYLNCLSQGPRVWVSRLNSSTSKQRRYWLCLSPLLGGIDSARKRMSIARGSSSRPVAILKFLTGSSRGYSQGETGLKRLP